MSTDLPIQMLDRKSRGRTKAVPPKKHKPPIVARMPEDLISLLEGAAKASFRSRSAEMVYRLRASFENQSIDEHGVIVHHVPAVRK